MNFEPANTDHAIEEVSFACRVSRRISATDIQRIDKAFEPLRSELPAVQLESNSAVFGYLRPDGTPTWAVQIKDVGISVLITRYSRWDKVWSTARKYLEVVLSAVENQDTTNLLAVELLVADRFLGQPDDSPATADVLKPSKFLMPMATTISEPWHSHVGWFDHKSEIGAVLNRLDLDRVNENIGDSNISVIAIRHVQQMRLQSPISVSTLFSAKADMLALAMQYMHFQNKNVLSELLIPEMQARISLAVDQ